MSSPEPDPQVVYVFVDDDGNQDFFEANVELAELAEAVQRHHNTEHNPLMPMRMCEAEMCRHAARTRLLPGQ